MLQDDARRAGEDTFYRQNDLYCVMYCALRFMQLTIFELFILTIAKKGCEMNVIVLDALL